MRFISCLMLVEYAIYDSKWVSLVHVVPKKAEITMVKDDNGQEILRVYLPSGWSILIIYALIKLQG